jgi:aminopeptidase N
MPLDFSVVIDDSTAYDFHVPNNWFVKQTEANILPRWIGWGKVKPEYSFNLSSEKPIKDVVIDPSNRLADINMLNNRKLNTTKIHFDSQVQNPADWRHYELFARPDVWYNFYDGLKIGFNLNGNYLNHKHIFNLSIWGNSTLMKLNNPSQADYLGYDFLSFRGDYKNSLEKISKNSWFILNLKWLDGLQGYTIGVEKFTDGQNNRFFLNLKGMYRQNINKANYLISPSEWGVNQFNSQVNAGLEHKYKYPTGNGNIQVWLKTIGPGSAYSFSQVGLQVVNKSTLEKFGINTRLFAMLGSGNNTPPETKLFLAGANPEEMMDNKFMRSAAFFPVAWGGYGDNSRNLQYGGGLNLRGYAGYLAPSVDKNGNVVFNYAGTSGASASVEVEFDRYFPFKPKVLKDIFELKSYLFADAGVLNINSPKEKLAFGPFRADAGVGLALTIKKWGAFQKIKPFTIRADFPLWLNRTPAIDPAYFQFRWQLGISRAF